MEDPFELVSIDPTDAPSGVEGVDWHQYVIRQGQNEIRGYRQGPLAVVTIAVEEIVTRLNERRSRPGRTHIVLRGRKRQ